MTMLLSLLVLSGLVWQIQGACRTANWWGSFDHEGLSRCQYLEDSIRGFWRNDQGDPDDIYRLEEAVCCDRDYQYDGKRNIYYANWWGTFDRDHTWSTCPSGFFLQGLWRTDSNDRLWNIEEGRCYKPANHPYHWGHCYDHDIGLSFDSKGTSQCNDGYYVVGLYRGGCDVLYCLEKMRCCKMAPRPTVLNSLASVKTLVMDRTLYYMALLAHYLGYGWCAGCRTPYVGEDFRRDGDTWIADRSGRCNGYKNEHRLSINYAHWKFGVTNMAYGQLVITDLVPETIDSGLITNNSPTESSRTIVRSEESVRTVTHTTTSSWTMSHELGIEISYTPSGTTGGVGSKVSYSFKYEKSSTTTDSTSKEQKKTLAVSDTKTLPPYSVTNVTLVVSKTRSTLPYTATIIARFSAEFRGFLRWGGGGGSGTTNYHYQHRGSGDRPEFNYRFGDASTSFIDALKQQSDTNQRPWEWADLKNYYGSAQAIINSLVSKGQYEFALSGKFDDVIGKRVDIIWTHVSGGTGKRSATASTDKKVVDMGTHRSVAKERPGDPKPVFPKPPAAKLDKTEEAKVDPVGTTLDQ